MNTITDFSMRDVWNMASLRPDRPLVERDYLWASQLNQPTVDNFLSMKGEKPTNPPNARSRRKFLAGNIWEDIQTIPIKAMGIRLEKQEEVWTHGRIKVKGKLDFLIEGKPDYEQARHYISKLYFSTELTDYLLAVVDRFYNVYGDTEFAPMVRECKSCSSYVIEKVQRGGRMIGHELQLYHYLKGLNLPMGYVDYISKDDALMEQVKVEYPNKDLEMRYERTIDELYEYLVHNERPPVSPLIVWEGKFQRNFYVEYSNYLTLLYGFETPEEYRNFVSKTITARNAVLARMKKIEKGETTPTGKPIVLTDKNKVALEEIEKAGFNIKELVADMMDIEEEEVNN